jgi:hypothetical protein
MVRARWETLASDVARLGLVLRGAFHPVPEDGAPALSDGAPTLTIVLLGWTGGDQWQVFSASPEANDGLPDPLNRWSKRLIDQIAADLHGSAFYPFGGPPWLDFQRWALKAEPVHRSPLSLLIHPKRGCGISTAGHSGFENGLSSAPAKMAQIPATSARSDRAFLLARSPPSRRAAPTTTLPVGNTSKALARTAGLARSVPIIAIPSRRLPSTCAGSSQTGSVDEPRQPPDGPFLRIR